ncbi:MAG: hypothetical protein PUC61_06805 [Bacteroidales bacterium]|nr:hypothetical protein [Bacteroidales bacterium]
MKRDILYASAPVNNFRIELPVMRQFRRDQNNFSFHKWFTDAAQGTDAPAGDDEIQLVSGLTVEANLFIGRYSDVVKSEHIANI